MDGLSLASLVQKGFQNWKMAGIPAQYCLLGQLWVRHVLSAAAKSPQVLYPDYNYHPALGSRIAAFPLQQACFYR
ncbi:MAG: hypothetical protein XE06_0798 [Anaerolineaceae bacterium 46_22]|nr:MAG: hypothetical protein XE06_0798 [Anaerolineaceae bacterium 46_22]